jgi:hypothetical protein
MVIEFYRNNYHLNVNSTCRRNRCQFLSNYYRQSNLHVLCYEYSWLVNGESNMRELSECFKTDVFAQVVKGNQYHLLPSIKGLLHTKRINSYKEG